MTFNAIYGITWNWASKVSLGSKEYIPSERLLLDWDGHLLLALWGNKNWPPSMKVKSWKSSCKR